MFNETNVQATKFTILADCPTNIFGRDNYFYVLSDNQANANNAQQICISSGGTLAETQNRSMQSSFIVYAVRRHIPSGMLQALEPLAFYQTIKFLFHTLNKLITH